MAELVDRVMGTTYNRPVSATSTVGRPPLLPALCKLMEIILL